MTEPTLGPIPTPPADPERGSFAAQLRGERQKIIDREPLYLPIPGYTHLVACYRPIAWEHAEDVIMRTGPLLDSMCDELIFACGGLYGLNPDGPETIKIAGRELRAEKVAGGYGPEIAELLGFESRNARQAVLGTFGDPDPGDHPHDDKGAGLRLSGHHDIVLAWMRGRPTDENDHGQIGNAGQEASGE